MAAPRTSPRRERSGSSPLEIEMDCIGPVVFSVLDCLDCLSHAYLIPIPNCALTLHLHIHFTRTLHTLSHPIAFPSCSSLGAIASGAESSVGIPGLGPGSWVPGRSLVWLSIRQRKGKERERAAESIKAAGDTTGVPDALVFFALYYRPTYSTLRTRSILSELITHEREFERLRFTRYVYVG
jgi:hypothetical protein